MHQVGEQQHRQGLGDVVVHDPERGGRHELRDECGDEPGRQGRPPVLARNEPPGEVDGRPDGEDAERPPARETPRCPSRPGRLLPRRWPRTRRRGGRSRRPTGRSPRRPVHQRVEGGDGAAKRPLDPPQVVVAVPVERDQLPARQGRSEPRDPEPRRHREDEDEREARPQVHAGTHVQLRSRRRPGHGHPPATRSRRVNAAPPPSELAASMLPPNDSMMEWLMARPRPLPAPGSLVVKNGSKTRGEVLGRDPRPGVDHRDLHASPDRPDHRSQRAPSRPWRLRR